MQQLSLFDFGDETPKQEKKKKPSQKDASPSKQEETNDATVNAEIQNADIDPAPVVPDQITNDDLPAPSNSEIPAEVAPIEQDPLIQETAESDKNLVAEGQSDSRQIPAEEPFTQENINNQEIPVNTNKPELAESEKLSIEPETENVQAPSESNSQNAGDAGDTADPAPESELIPGEGINAPQITQNFQEDIVFSDESIIVKFKPKINPNTIGNNASALGADAVEKQQAVSTGSGEKEDAEKAENQSIEEKIYSDQIKTDELDTSFPPKSEQNLDIPSEINATNQSVIPATPSNDSIGITDDTNTQTQSNAAEVMPAEPIEGIAVKTGSAEGLSNAKDEHFDDDQPADEKELIQDYEHSSSVPPREIHHDTTKLQEEESVSIDLDHLETENVENGPIVDREENKGVLPIIAHKRGRKSFKEIDAEVDLIDVPSDEELFKKQYYPISVVAKWFRVNNSLLRFWENEFKILKPKKNKKGDRFFRPEDVKNLQIIYYLLRQKKLTINGAIKHLKSKKEHTEVNLQIIQSLGEFKGFLLELRATTEK